jgi:thymidylate synthase ThyX
MTISAQIIADSISPQGIRLTTFQVTCHRFILPEINTHRMFSRNWASSRAIPTSKLIEMVRTNPAMPVHWGKNQPGMQAHGEMEGDDLDRTMSHWISAAQDAAEYAEMMANCGAHKQLVNRVLEPFLWVRGVITATDYANFYALRRHEDAQPEIKALADAMWEAQQASTPQLIVPGEWHLPYLTAEDYRPLQMKSGTLGIEWDALALKVSTARCARVSYLTQDGKPTTVEADLALYERLIERAPLHASPAEHQATPDTREKYATSYMSEKWDHPEQHGNLKGWRQFRKTLPQEFVSG